MAEATYEGLYKPRSGDPGSVGDALLALARKGRQDIRKEWPRWRENRSFYTGQQWLNNAAYGSRDAARLFVHDQAVPINGRRRVTYNRLRQMVDGRLSQYSSNRPPLTVRPPARDPDLMDAARQATRFLEAMWRVWDVQRVLRDLARAGEIDGVSFLYVGWDRNANAKVEIAYPIDPQTGQEGPPSTDRAQIEALRAQDPEAKTLWRNEIVDMGDVSWRVVKPENLSIDPFGDDWGEKHWIIETRVMDKAVVEKMAGKSVEDLIKQSKPGSMGPSTGRRESNPPVALDEGGVGGEADKDRIIVHEAFVRPWGDFPQGAHCLFLDAAPNAPLMAESWDDDLPYFPFTPRPGPDKLVCSRGTVDDCKGVQLSMNWELVLYEEILRKIARPPVLVTENSLKSNSLYREEGFVEKRQGFEDPHEMRTASDPTSLQNKLGWDVEQMGEIANLPNVLRGQPAGQGVESAIGQQTLEQNAEQTMATTVAEFVRVVEWGGSRALKLVEKNYVIPRFANGPGVEDQGELQAFTGAMIRGSTDVVVDGAVMPKQRAAQINTALQLLPVLGERALPYVSKFIEGDVDAFLAEDEANRRNQKTEIARLVAIGGMPQVGTVFGDFQAQMGKYAQALQAAAANPMMVPAPPDPNAPPPEQPEQPETGSTVTKRVHPRPGGGQFEETTTVPHEAPEQPGMASPPMPMQPVPPKAMLQQAGISEPRLTDLLMAAGIKVPMPEDDDDHGQHIAVIRTYTQGDAWKGLTEASKQLVREHRNMHLEKLGGPQVAAMAQQMPPEQGPQGSQAAPKGQPSPPRQRGMAGGQAGIPGTPRSMGGP